jgi:transposase InsO family protein
MDEVRQRLPRAIQRVQTDNGNEFGTDFTWNLRDLGIEHRHILPGCPEVNGKVERSHRTDGEEFYRRTTFRTLGELREASPLGTRVQPSPSPSRARGQDPRRARVRAQDHPTYCAGDGLIGTIGTWVALVSFRRCPVALFRRPLIERASALWEEHLGAAQVQSAVCGAELALQLWRLLGLGPHGWRYRDSRGLESQQSGGVWFGRAPKG